MAKFAIFVDLENCGAKVPTLNSILEKVKIRGDILLGKVYERAAAQQYIHRRAVPALWHRAEE